MTRWTRFSALASLLTGSALVVAGCLSTGDQPMSGPQSMSAEGSLVSGDQAIQSDADDADSESVGEARGEVRRFYRECRYYFRCLHRYDRFTCRDLLPREARFCDRFNYRDFEEDYRRDRDWDDRWDRRRGHEREHEHH